MASGRVERYLYVIDHWRSRLKILACHNESMITKLWE